MSQKIMILLYFYYKVYDDMEIILSDLMQDKKLMKTISCEIVRIEQHSTCIYIHIPQCI